MASSIQTGATTYSATLYSMTDEDPGIMRPRSCPALADISGEEDIPIPSSRSFERIPSCAEKFHRQEIPLVSVNIWKLFSRKVQKALESEGSDISSTRCELRNNLDQLFNRIFQGEDPLPVSVTEFLQDIDSKTLAEVTQKYAPLEGVPPSPLAQEIPTLFHGLSTLQRRETSALREKLFGQLQLDGAGRKDEMLRLLMHEKTMSRSRKGEYNFDAFVLDRVEITDFVNQLQANLPEEGSRRIQLLVRSGVHYTALDFEMSSEGLKCFIMDAANDPNCFKVAQELRELGIDEIYLASVKDEKGQESNKLQHDGNSCPVFSMDHIVHSSKMPKLFDDLRVKPQEFVDGIRHVSWIDMSPSLVKNAQSISFLERYLKKNPGSGSEVYKAGQVFEEYLKGKFGHVEEKGREGNLAGKMKLARYREKLEPVIRVRPDDVLSEITCRYPHIAPPYHG
ncbi:MAG: hypothetical protein ACI9S8_002017 [Chlamydiales bacterium]